MIPRLHPGTEIAARVSVIPGLSPWGRTVLARLEHHRLWPGATADALQFWEEFVRNPYHRVHDYRYDEDGCGHWKCCPGMIRVRWVLDVVASSLPGRDGRRFRARVAALDEDW